MPRHPAIEALQQAYPPVDPRDPGASAQLSALKMGTKARPMNWFERHFLAPKTQAMTYPWGSISYNPSHLPPTQPEIDDVLTHEQAHVGQIKRRGMLGTALDMLRESQTPYYNRPAEREAFDAEAARKRRQTDIRLGPEP